MMLSVLVAAADSAADQPVSLDRRIQAAMVTNDTKVLSAAIADDFRFAHADGSVETKSDVIRTSAARTRYYLRRKVLAAAAHVRGRVATVSGTLDVASGRLPGDPPGLWAMCYTLTYVHVYTRRSNRWQLLSHRTTAMTIPEHPCRAQT
jgi:hypothetical protein